MRQVILGRTGIVTDANGFGALPIQRIGMQEAVYLLQKAFDGGITYFDTANGYTDSEEKIGAALSGVRDRLFLATKTPSSTPEGFRRDLELSLSRMKTDYIDVYQFHNPSFVPKPGDGSGLYEEMLRAKEAGKIRHIGITCHAICRAVEAVESGLYDTLQYPFSYLAHEKEIELVRLCKAKQVGFVAMKGMSGGLIRNSAAAAAFLSRFPNVLPIWGVQHEWELDEFLSYRENPPVMTPELEALIAKDRAELTGDFCRACGYCMPCPQGIQIPTCARMTLLMGRAPRQPFLSPDWQAEMEKINTCLECGQCTSRCPYGLNTPELLKKNLADYQRQLQEK